MFFICVQRDVNCCLPVKMSHVECVSTSMQSLMINEYPFSYLSCLLRSWSRVPFISRTYSCLPCLFQQKIKPFTRVSMKGCCLLFHIFIFQRTSIVSLFDFCERIEFIVIVFLSPLKFKNLSWITKSVISGLTTLYILVDFNVEAEYRSDGLSICVRW